MPPRRPRIVAASANPTRMHSASPSSTGSLSSATEWAAQRRAKVSGASSAFISSLAVDEVMRLLTNRDAARPLLEDAEAAVASANTAIFMRSQSNQNLNGMGTTLVSLLAEDQRGWLINVGDSRGYRMRNSHLEQITLDHSLVEEQVRMGRMDPAEALRSPFKNVITRALGTQSSITPDIFELENEPGDLFMLCSDGLTRELADPTIEWILKLDLPLQELCTRLVEAANNSGGHDNITCLLVRAEA